MCPVPQPQLQHAHTPLVLILTVPTVELNVSLTSWALLWRILSGTKAILPEVTRFFLGLRTGGKLPASVMPVLSGH